MTLLLSVVLGSSSMTAIAADPLYKPGPSVFPMQNTDNAPTPDKNFPYANQGLQDGLNTAEQNLPKGIQKQRSFTRLVIDWINYFLQFYMFVTVGIVIYFGVQILISREKTDKRKEAVTAIVNIAIGTLLMFMAYGIVIAIVNLVNPDEFKNLASTEKTIQKEATYTIYI